MIISERIHHGNTTNHSYAYYSLYFVVCILMYMPGILVRNIMNTIFGQLVITLSSISEPSKEKECYLVRFASCMATKVKKMTTDDVSVDDQAIFSVHEKSSTYVCQIV